MILDNIDLDKLPQGDEDAFVFFERKIRQEYERERSNDRDFHTEHDVGYEGSFAPERMYLSAILAFIDEYNLDIDLPDISDLSGYEFESNFGKFIADVGYAATRFSLRKYRIEAGSAGTVILISSTYKSEIGDLLGTIRKIVNQEVEDIKKKDKIFSKIASLQSEVDREQTTLDAFCGRAIDLSKAIGECADNLEPLVKKMEQIKRIFWDHSNKVKLLPKKERLKLITKQDTDESEDKLPF